MKPSHYLSKKGDKCDSLYERDVANSLFDRGISYEHHPGPFAYSTPVIGGFCPTCDANGVRQSRLYTPDFRLFPSGWLVEAKGKFVGRQRGLMAHFVRTHDSPQPLAFIFMRDNKLSRTSTTRLAAWARRLKCPSAIGIHIPAEWAEGRTA